MNRSVKQPVHSCTRIRRIPRPSFVQPGSGFTLIELLVVIAIISLLVSILLPSLSKAKDLAKATICMHNLKSISLGMNLYLDENEQTFPVTTRSSSEEPAFADRKPWPFYLAEYCPVQGNWGSNNHDAEKAGVFHCPSDDFRLERGYAPASYGANYYSDCRWIDRDHYAGKLTEVAWPGARIYTVDSYNPAGGYCRISVSVLGIKNLTTYGLGFRHNNEEAVNALFMDWHVETLREYDTLGNTELVYPLN